MDRDEQVVCIDTVANAVNKREEWEEKAEGLADVLFTHSGTAGRVAEGGNGYRLADGRTVDEWAVGE